MDRIKKLENRIKDLEQDIVDLSKITDHIEDETKSPAECYHYKTIECTSANE